MVLVPLGVLVFIFCVKDLEVVKNLTPKSKRSGIERKALNPTKEF